MTAGPGEQQATAGLAGFRAVLFDLDGTLIDSKPLIKAAFVHALKEASASSHPGWIQWRFAT